MVVLSLDSRNKLIDTDIVSIATLNASLAHPREIFNSAIKNHTASIILAHNHPSGDVQPSKDDRIRVHEIIKSGDILGIKMINHIILTSSKCYSSKGDKLLTLN